MDKHSFLLEVVTFTKKRRKHKEDYQPFTTDVSFVALYERREDAEAGIIISVPREHYDRMMDDSDDSYCVLYLDCDVYQGIEDKQFDNISPLEREQTYALFGTDDTLVQGYDEYMLHYKNAGWFKGGHRLNFEVIKTIVIPLIKKIMIYETLKASPLFNLSLSSKELFHSNFLYWLGTQYPGLFVEVCKEIGCKADWADSTWEIKREHNNFDLCVINSEKEKDVKLVLENKVKSIPQKSQLDEYQKKAGNDVQDLILLSLVTDFPDRKSIEAEARWNIKSYTDLHDAILKYKNQFVNDSYHSALIDDYCRFVKCLHELSKSWMVQDEHTFLLSDSDKKESKALRVGDLQDKIWYSQLIIKLNTQLQELKPIKVTSNIDINGIREKGRCLDEVFTNWGFTHSQGLLEAKIRIDKDYVLLIQLQGDKYCHGIEWLTSGNHNELWKQTQNINLVKELGFLKFSEGTKEMFPSICQDTPITIRVKGKKETETRIYNKYGNTFLYQYKKIKPDATVAEVITAIKNEVEQIIDKARELSIRLYNCQSV